MTQIKSICMLNHLVKYTIFTVDFCLYRLFMRIFSGWGRGKNSLEVEVTSLPPSTAESLRQALNQSKLPIGLFQGHELTPPQTNFFIISPTRLCPFLFSILIPWRKLILTYVEIDILKVISWCQEISNDTQVSP